MSNMIRGEIALANGTKLVLDYNAFCELEDSLGEPADATIARCFTPQARHKDIRAIIHVAALRHQPNFTLFEAGDLIADNPTVLIDLFTACFPNVDKGADAGNGPRPKKTRA